MDRKAWLRERDGSSRTPVEARELDVAEDESIKKCMSWIRDDLGRLDILVNNAGIMVEDDDADPEQELQIVRDTMQDQRLRSPSAVATRNSNHEEPPLRAHRQSVERDGIAH